MVHSQAYTTVYSRQAVRYPYHLTYLQDIDVGRLSAVVGFVRSYGKILQEEDILLNAVCPNKIRTNIGTAASYEKAEKAGCLVPMENLLKAFEMLLAKEGEFSHVSGECLEISPKIGVWLRPGTEFVNEESRLSAEIT